MILSLAACANTQAEWHDADVSSNGKYAYTSVFDEEEDPNAMLYYGCATQENDCFIRFVSKNACEYNSDDVGFPALMTIDDGVYHVDLYCSQPVGDEFYSYSFFSTGDAFKQEDFRAGWAAANTVSFALPMKSGAFRAHRFDMKHSKKKFYAVEALAKDMDQSNKPGVGYVQPTQSGEF